MVYRVAGKIIICKRLSFGADKYCILMISCLFLGLTFPLLVRCEICLLCIDKMLLKKNHFLNIYHSKEKQILFHLAAKHKGH